MDDRERVMENERKKMHSEKETDRQQDNNPDLSQRKR